MRHNCVLVGLCAVFLAGCATYTRETTEIKADGTRVVKKESGVRYEASPYYVGTASPVYVSPMTVVPAYNPYQGVVVPGYRYRTLPVMVQGVPTCFPGVRNAPPARDGWCYR
jgi:hypothetical protein